MKILKIATLLLLAFSLYQCKKTPEAEPQDVGELVAHKNNKTWKATATILQGITFPDRMSFSFIHYDSLTGLTDRCSVHNLPISLGTYEVKPNPTNLNVDSLIYGSYGNMDYDVVVSIYDILGGQPNRITLDSYDSAAKEYLGALNLAFIVERKSDASMPDTIWIKNGTFRAIVVN